MFLKDLISFSKKKGCNIFENMSNDDYKICRKRIINCVLATDMTLHGKEFQFFASYINRDGYNVSATGVEKKDSDILNGGINENNKFKNMKKIIISEEQEISLIKILREEKEKHEKKYSIDPNKVLILKKKLDKSFIPLDYELIKGGNADCIKIAGRLTPKTRQVIEKLYEEDLADWAADCCKDMFLDNDECEKFAKLVVNRWLNNNIGVHGMLDVNYFY